MRIRKTSQSVATTGKIVNSASESTEEAYSCNYINNMNTYSTDEVRSGTWIDGKPIYRKVITGAMPVVETSGTSVSVSVSLSSLSMDNYIIEWNTIIYSNRRFIFPHIASAGNTILNIDQGKNLKISSNITDFNTSSWICSILYTKTTDTASSSTRSISSEENTEEDNTESSEEETK